MKSVRILWPLDYKDIWEIKHEDYVVEINWSRNLFEDYCKLASQYYKCGYYIFKEVIESGHNNVKSDMWFLPGIFFMRHAFELVLKALILRAYNRKSDVQNIFLESCHNLSKIFSSYELKNEAFLSLNEKCWLRKYLASIEKIDEKSDMFRFPFEDDFLIQYRNKFLNNVSVANNMVYAWSLFEKCINSEKSNKDSDIDYQGKPEFLSLSNHGIGNCHIWEPISDNGFHTKITGYNAVADYLFFECDNLTHGEKLYPLVFLLRNSIELSLKRLFYSGVKNGIPDQIFYSKRKSDFLKKDLWKNVRPILDYYADNNYNELSDLDIVEDMILQIDEFDKKGDAFRYPTSYSFEYRINGRKLDLKNVFNLMRSIINFLDGCDSLLDVISDYETDIYSQYFDYY